MLLPLAAFMTDSIRDDGFHQVLSEEVEGLRSPELSAVVDEPHAELHAASESGLLDVRHRIFLLQDNRLAKGEETASFQLVGNPRGMTIAEKQHHTRLRLENALVLGGYTEDEVEIALGVGPLVPFSKVGFHDLASTHRETGVPGNIVRKVGTDEVDVVVRDLLHKFETVPLDDAVFHSFGILVHRQRIKK